MRLRAHAQTSASPAQVWEVLGAPARWPEFEPFLRRVRGTHGGAAAGQTLVGVSRVGGVAFPLDVVEVVPSGRLVLRVHTAPGVRHTMAFEVLPNLEGGSDLRLAVGVDGLFARPAAGPLWLSGALTVRLLAARCDRLARAARPAA